MSNISFKNTLESELGLLVVVALPLELFWFVLVGTAFCKEVVELGNGLFSSDRLFGLFSEVESLAMTVLSTSLYLQRFSRYFGEKQQKYLKEFKCFFLLNLEIFLIFF